MQLEIHGTLVQLPWYVRGSTITRTKDGNRIDFKLVPVARILLFLVDIFHKNPSFKYTRVAKIKLPFIPRYKVRSYEKKSYGLPWIRRWA